MPRFWDYLSELFQGFRHPSLESIVAKLLRDQFSTNAELLKCRYSWPRRSLRAIVRRKRMTVVLLLACYFFTAAIAWYVYPFPQGPQVPAHIKDYYRDIQTITSGLITAQATLIGLVFPIVIALVSLLTDGRVTNQGRLQLFLSETEAALVGISGLSFLFIASVQMLLFSQVPDRVGAALTVINILWFGFNVVTIGFFLFQTLRYVQPGLRFEIQKKYSANVVWRYQLADIIRNNRWLNSAHYGYLPDPKSYLHGATTYPIISPL